MLPLMLVQFIAFPERKDVVLSSKEYSNNEVNVASSGSIGLYFAGKCHQTYPNETLHTDQKMDWCSNVVEKNSNDKPWITYSLKNKAIKLTGFSLRNGCCWYDCCCIDDNNYIPYHCCCRLYSFSLLGSNDNITWKTIHKEEKIENYWICLFKTFTFAKTEPFNFLKLQMDEPYPGCPSCLQINEVEFYGETVNSLSYYDDLTDSEESVSIIGKISHHSN